MSEAPKFLGSIRKLKGGVNNFCYGVVMISPTQVLVDCALLYPDDDLQTPQDRNRFYVLDEKGVISYSRFYENWNYKWQSIKGRKFVRYYQVDDFGN